MSRPESDAPKLTLYRGWRSPGEYVWSPFVTKVEFRLRVAGIPYTTEAGSILKAPKGKIPYIRIDGRRVDLQDESLVDVVADSTIINRTLVELGLIEDVNAELSSVNRALDLSLRALLEDKLYFFHIRERWCENYYAMRDHVLSELPYLVRVVLGLVIYRKAGQNLHGQGTGRFTADEIRLFRQEIWATFNDLLATSKNASQSEKPFWVLGGTEPTEADASLFAFITSVLFCVAAPESRTVVKSYPVIVEYAERIHAQYFPDYQHWDEGN